MKYLPFIFLLLFSSGSFSQQYKDMIEEGTHSVYEIQAVAEPYFEIAGTGKGTGYKQYKRWEYNALHSMDEQGNILTKEALLNEYFRNEQDQNRLVDDSNWEELGPTTWNSTSGWNPGVGRITSFSVDPDDENHIIVGSPSGGVWRTINGGTTWDVLTDSFINLDVYSLTIHPVNKSTYYWGSTSGIIFVSTDAGANWNELVNLSGSSVNKILIHPDTPSTMFCTIASGGVFRSTNSGVSWSGDLTGETTGYDIEFKPGDTNTVYATGNRFYKSTNGGTTFSEVSSSFTAGQTKMIGVSIDDTTVVYVIEENSGIFGGFYKSTNSGSSFTKLTHTANYFGYSDTGNDNNGQAPRDMDIVVSPTDINEVHIAGIHTWRSLNGGTSFTLSSYWSEGGAISRNVGYCHADVDIMQFVGSNLYVGSDGGLYINTDSDATISTTFYTDLTAGLGIRQFYKIGVSQSNPEIIVGGSQDNGSSFYNAAGQWFDWLGADGMENFIDKNNNNIFYGTSQGGVLYKSTNGGLSYFGLTAPDGKSGNWVTPFEQDPITQNVIYSGYDQVYKSTNGGSNWTAISQDFGPNMDYLKIAPSDNQVMYGSVDGNLYKTIDGGATNWSTLTGYGGSFINDIAIHPNDPNRIAIATNSNDKVYISVDGGANWTAMRLNLPNFSVFSLVWENVVSNRLFVGMNYGIYYIDDNNAQWQVFANNLPNVRVYEMEINTTKGMLYAGTYGRGVFRSLLPDVSSDTESPTNPTNLAASNITQTTLDLNWTASTDNIAVTGYEVFQDGVSIGVSAVTSYNVSSLTPATSYDFTVNAFDANGNTSGLSNVETAITLDSLPIDCDNIVTSITYSESFETLNDLGFWTQVGGDDGDWIQDSSGTPSVGTGPSSGSDGSFYLFLEASTNGSSGEIGSSATAILEGPCLDLSTFQNVQFTFDYHAYGDNISTANLVVQGSTAADIWFDLYVIPTPITSQDLWISQSIDLSGYNENIKIRIVGTTGNSWSSDLAIDNVGFSFIPACGGDSKTWNGTTWNPTGAPDITNHIIIDGDYNTEDHGDLNACTLTLNSNKTLTISALDYANIAGGITVNTNSFLIINHEGSLVQTDDNATVTNNGTIQVIKSIENFDDPTDFSIIGSPMSTETRDGVFSTNVITKNHITANFVPNSEVAIYDSGAENFADDNGDNWQFFTSNEPILPGVGYIVGGLSGGGNYTSTHTQGTLNNGVIPFAAEYNTPGPGPSDNQNASPNMLSNPYSSAIDATLFISQNSSFVDDIYYWEHIQVPGIDPNYPGHRVNNYHMGDISLFNGSMGIEAANAGGGSKPSNQIIASGQGFAIKAKGAGTINFNNSMRVTGPNDTYRSGAVVMDQFYLKVENPTYQLQSGTGIGFTELATDGYESNYDTKRLATSVSIYSVVDDHELALQGRSAFHTDQIVPIGFRTMVEEPQIYTISLSSLEGENLSEATVYLQDNLLNTTTNLSEGAYTFTSNVSNQKDRFVIVFTEEVLGSNDVFEESISVYPNPTENYINIVSPLSEITDLTLYDLRGRVLQTIELGNQTSCQLDMSNLETSMYFIKIHTQNGSITKQIIKQ